MSKHTKEPWFHHDPAGSQHTMGGYINASELREGPAIAHVFGSGFDFDEYKENARRIVACVNACAGISNEMLADGCFGKMMRDRDSLLAERNELLAERNELLAALEVITGWSEDAIVCMQEATCSAKSLKQMQDCGIIPSEIISARAAIAKAKGV